MLHANERPALFAERDRRELLRRADIKTFVDDEEGFAMKEQSINPRSRAAQDGQVKNGKSRPAPPLPTGGAPLDGSQYQNIVEEQKYSGQRPTREEQQPRHANQDKKG